MPSTSWYSPELERLTETVDAQERLWNIATASCQALSVHENTNSERDRRSMGVLGVLQLLISRHNALRTCAHHHQPFGFDMYVPDLHTLFTARWQPRRSTETEAEVFRRSIDAVDETSNRYTAHARAIDAALTIGFVNLWDAMGFFRGMVTGAGAEAVAETFDNMDAASDLELRIDIGDDDAGEVENDQMRQMYANLCARMPPGWLAFRGHVEVCWLVILASMAKLRIPTPPRQMLIEEFFRRS